MCPTILLLPITFRCFLNFNIAVSLFLQISKEEYGSRGFSYEALELDRKAATERVKAIFDDDEDDDDGTEKRKEKSVQAGKTICQYFKMMPGTFGSSF